LARAGRRVLLADRPSAAWKIGEALPGAAVRLLRALDLPAPEREGPHTAIAGTVSAWGSPQFTATDALRDPYGTAWRLDRHRFDAELRQAARAAGTALRPALLRNVARDGECWRLGFDDGGEERARWIVDAGGRSARIARKLGAKRLRDSRLIALYRIGAANADFCDSRTFIESTPNGWWYASRLPSGAAVAGFHTDAAEATRIRAEPQAWLDALAATRGLAPLFASMHFAQILPAADAGGARLTAFYGEGWIACGDAAIGFDPISGQGIFAALHDGSAAADAVNAALDGEQALLGAYARRLEEVWSIYCARRDAMYSSERRWPDRPFWLQRPREKAA
jgi:flavin-dependent dehydrogenase